MSFLLAMEGAVAQGVLWSVMALGVYITFRLLDYADLSVDGSFATGGAVSAVLVLKGADPYLSLLAALAAGLLCGWVTGFLNTRLKIQPILSGILTMIALYSVNLRIMGFAANLPLLGVDTIVSRAGAVLPGGSDPTAVSLLIGLAAAGVLIGAMYWFFGTEIGCALRATGNNKAMARAFGVSTDRMVVLGLMLSNGLVALSGAMVAQSQGYADVGMGTGTIVIGLASVIIGETLMRRASGFAWRLAAVVLGSVLYRVIIAAVLRLGLKSTDLKLLTAVLVALALAVPVFVKSALWRAVSAFFLGIWRRIHGAGGKTDRKTPAPGEGGPAEKGAR